MTSSASQVRVVTVSRLLVKVTRVPILTVRLAGWKAPSLISTYLAALVVVGGGVVEEVGGVVVLVVGGVVALPGTAWQPGWVHWSTV